MCPAGVHWLSTDRLDAEIGTLGAGNAAIFELPTGIGSADEFFEQCCARLPMDPPFEKYHRQPSGRLERHWDALDDSLSGGLATVAEDTVIIVWRDPGTLAAQDADAATTAAHYFAKLAEEAVDPQVNGWMKTVVVLLGATRIA